MLAVVGLASPCKWGWGKWLHGILLRLTHFPPLQYRGHLSCGPGWLNLPNSGWTPHRNVSGNVKSRAFDLVVLTPTWVRTLGLCCFHFCFVLLFYYFYFLKESLYMFKVYNMLIWYTKSNDHNSQANLHYLSHHILPLIFFCLWWQHLKPTLLGNFQHPIWHY